MAKRRITQITPHNIQGTLVFEVVEAKILVKFKWDGVIFTSNYVPILHRF